MAPLKCKKTSQRLPQSQNPTRALGLSGVGLRPFSLAADPHFIFHNSHPVVVICCACVKRCDLHVVIMSATINPDLFVSYFAPEDDQSSDQRLPPVLEIAGRAFPVEVCYEASPADDDYVTAACLKVAEIHRQEPRGDVLVFLTSPLETEKV